MEYYALCVKWEDSEDSRVAPLDLGEDEDGSRILALAIYTSSVGAQQLEDLGKYGGGVEVETTIRKVSARELLTAVQANVPNFVYIDGRKHPRAVLSADLRTQLGLPIRHPRWVRLESDDEEEDHH